jgi:hypothetical protein
MLDAFEISHQNSKISKAIRLYLISDPVTLMSWSQSVKRHPLQAIGRYKIVMFVIYNQQTETSC